MVDTSYLAWSFFDDGHRGFVRDVVKVPGQCHHAASSGTGEATESQQSR